MDVDNRIKKLEIEIVRLQAAMAGDRLAITILRGANDCAAKEIARLRSGIADAISSPISIRRVFEKLNELLK